MSVVIVIVIVIVDVTVFLILNGGYVKPSAVINAADRYEGSSMRQVC